MFEDVYANATEEHLKYQKLQEKALDEHEQSVEKRIMAVD